MAGQLGRSGGWNRLPAEAWECACGMRKSTPHAQRCQRCTRSQGTRDAAGRLNYQTPCACGRLKSRNSARCQACFKAARFDKSHPVSRCVGCDWPFRRRHRSHDAGRYCSRACAFAHWSEIRQQDPKNVQARLRPKPVKHCARCQCPPGSPRAKYCDACSEVRRWEKRDLARRATRRWLRSHPRPRRSGPPVTHTCPGCGESFTSVKPNAVFCSFRCMRQSRKVLKGSPLSVIPVAEREQIAQLVSLRRAANKRVDDIRKGRPYQGAAE